MFDLRLEHIATWICDGGYTSVAIQLPEGLKLRAMEISDFIEANTHVVVSILGDPCYGACDLQTIHIPEGGCLIHFGHSSMPSLITGNNVLFVDTFHDQSVPIISEELLSELPNRVGILATVQYVHMISGAKKVLESKGIIALVGVGDARTAYPGQILGCNCSSAEFVASDVDAFLYLGEGDFHPLAAAFGMKKEIIVLNPITGEKRSVDDVRDRILRKRFALIETAKSARSFIVIVCSKVGQRRESEADRLINMIKRSGRTAYKVIMEEISPDRLLSYNVDIFVNTGCPRISMDDQARYSRPMLTVPEAEIAIGERTWDDYIFDVIRP